MADREKLIELIAKAKAMYADDYTDHTEDEYIAETLLDNFVTVWDGKPLEAFLHPIDAYKGLKAKYLVFKADTGERVDNCFILRPDKDAAAVEALRAYAKATDNETLAKDIYNWVGNGVTVRERGRWEVDYADSGEPGGYEAFIEVHCQKCGYDIGIAAGEYGWAYGDPFPMNFCPNCGADMR